MEALKRAGGVEGLAKALGSDVHQGLNPEGSAPAGSPSDVGLHRQMYGVNKFTEVPPKSLWSIIYDNLQDPIIITLILAALVRRHPPPLLSLSASSSFLNPAAH